MARIRSVKPEICESETVARLSAEVERTFVRLWTHCDDHGRAKDDPRLIKAALFPILDAVTAEVVDGHLWQLAAEGLIVRYEVDGKRFLACPSWAEHQHPQRPRDSKLPAPSEGQPVTLPETYATCTRGLLEPSGPVVVVGEVDVEGAVEVEVDVAASTSSQDYTSSEPVTESNHAAEVDQPTRQRAIRLVSDLQAADGSNPAGLAHTIRQRMADPTDRDRERIEASLTAGLSPEQIVTEWAAAPMPPLLAVVPSPSDEEVREAARRREAETAAKRQEITSGPVGDRQAGLAAARAARSNPAAETGAVESPDNETGMAR